MENSITDEAPVQYNQQQHLLKTIAEEGFLQNSHAEGID